MSLRIQARRATRLADAFAAAAGGEGRALILEGSLGRAAESAEAAGLRVLHAHAGVSDAPFATAVALLAPAVTDDLFAGAASLTRPLFSGDQAVAGEFAVVHGLYWLTARLADRTPLALLLGNAGRADEPSLRVCAYLAQRIDELPVALVLA
jgi:hypothetical protein